MFCFVYKLAKICVIIIYVKSNLMLFFILDDIEIIESEYVKAFRLCYVLLLHKQKKYNSYINNVQNNETWTTYWVLYPVIQ